MRSPVFSYIALALLVIVLAAKADLFSRETFVQEYREKFHVEPRVSSDGIFRLTLCEHKPVENVNAWAPNHTRSFRALLVNNESTNEQSIFVEQARPRMCYKLEGEKVLQNIDHVYWLSATTLGFVVGNSTGIGTEYFIDIRTLSSTHHPEHEGSEMKKFGIENKLID
jgi:hypothetical protein